MDANAEDAHVATAPTGVPALDARSSIGDVARTAFASSVERLVRYDAVLRAAADEEAVHQARVAVRRMRSDLRTFAPVLDEPWADGLRERMRWLQDGFSQARDADVLLAHLEREAQELPAGDRRDAGAVFERFHAARELAYEHMRAMLGEPRYAALLQELAGAVARPPFGAAAGAPARDVAGSMVGEAWAKLRKRVRARSRPPADAELHAIRIAAKRARYAAEAVAPVVRRRAHALATSIEKIQTILGEQHDAAVARERLRSLANGAHAFRAGELAALAHRTACAKAVAWRGAWRDAKRCYRRFRDAS